MRSPPPAHRVRQGIARASGTPGCLSQLRVLIPTHLGGGDRVEHEWISSRITVVSEQSTGKDLMSFHKSHRSGHDLPEPQTVSGIQRRS